MHWKEYLKTYWKTYIPTYICFGFAFLFFLFPAFAIFLLITTLLLIGALYAWIVYRIHQAQLSISNPTEFEEEILKQGDPNFKTITITFMKKKHWFDA